MAGSNPLAEVQRALRERRFGDAGKPLRDHAYVPPSGGGFIVTKGERSMAFVKKFIVRKHERGLLYKSGDFVRFLTPGIYRFVDPRGRYSVERLDLTQPAFEHRLAQYFLRAERLEIARLFEVVETRADEVALVYHDERVAAVLGPAERKLYSKGVVTTRVERFDLGHGLKLDADIAKQLFNGREARVLDVAHLAVYARIVPEGHVGLLYVDGELTETLRAGLHALWRYGHGVSIELVDLRLKTLEVQAYGIPTHDGAALRVSLTATYRFVDAAKAARAVTDPLDHLHRETQLALRTALGTCTLDALLENPAAIERDVAAHLSKHFTEIGVAVLGVGLRDIVR